MDQDPPLQYFMPYVNKEKQKQYQKLWQRKRVKRLQQLKNNPCVDCGIKYHVSAMQWDHLPGQKKFKMLSKMSQYTFERCLKEIKKMRVSLC